MNIVITGASKGIGRAIVYRLAQVSGNNILMISRNSDSLKEVKEDCEKLYDSGSKLSYLRFDLSESDDIKEELMPQIQDQFDTIDILINNAGYLNNKSFLDFTHEEFIRHFEVNVFSVFELIRHCIPFMRSSQVRHIVNIGTMGAIQNRKKFPGLSAYSSSKTALAGLTEVLYEEMKPDEIRINYLALGAVETDMFREAFPEGKTTVMPDEMAAFIAKFALNDWKLFNGKIIQVSL